MQTKNYLHPDPLKCRGAKGFTVMAYHPSTNGLPWRVEFRDTYAQATIGRFASREVAECAAAELRGHGYLRTHTLDLR